MSQYSELHGALPWTEKSYQFGLTGSAVISQVLPGTSAITYRVQFSIPSGSSVWVGLNTVPVLPSDNTILPSPNCALNPTVKFARGGDTLNFISIASATNIGFELMV